MQDVEISMVEYLLAIVKRWYIIVLFMVVALCVAELYNRSVPDVYRAECVILPENSQNLGSGGVALAAQFAGLSLGQDQTNSKKIEIFLKSKIFAKRVARKIRLYDVVIQGLPMLSEKVVSADPLISESEKVLRGANILLGMINVVPNVSVGTMRVIVEAQYPKLAFDVNKQVMLELKSFLQDEDFTKAKKKRVFIGDQLLAIKRELLETGKKLSQSNSGNKFSTISSTVDVNLQLFSSNIAEGVDSGQLESDNTVKNVPQQTYFEFEISKKQTLLTLDTLMTQQYEIAKIEEQRENATFQIINEVELPEQPYIMKKRIIMYVSLLLAFFVALLYIFGLEYYNRVKS